MAACFNLLSQMIAGIVGLCSLGDLNPLSLLRKGWGNISVPARGLALQGKGVTVPGKGEFSSSLGTG